MAAAKQITWDDFQRDSAQRLREREAEPAPRRKRATRKTATKRKSASKRKGARKRR